MKKIDNALKEVRRWKRKVSLKTAKMSTEEAIAYFRSARKELGLEGKRKKAA